jgi:hypothetical protein
MLVDKAHNYLGTSSLHFSLFVSKLMFLLQVNILEAMSLRYDYGIQQIPAVFLFDIRSEPREYYTVRQVMFLRLYLLTVLNHPNLFWAPCTDLHSSNERSSPLRSVIYMNAIGQSKWQKLLPTILFVYNH